jgi:hypothetical protein
VYLSFALHFEITELKNKQIAEMMFVLRIIFSSFKIFYAKRPATRAVQSKNM